MGAHCGQVWQWKYPGEPSHKEAPILLWVLLSEDLSDTYTTYPREKKKKQKQNPYGKRKGQGSILKHAGSFSSS